MILEGCYHRRAMYLGFTQAEIQASFSCMSFRRHRRATGPTPQAVHKEQHGREEPALRGRTSRVQTPLCYLWSCITLRKLTQPLTGL